MHDFEGSDRALLSDTMMCCIRCHYRGRLASNNAVFDSSYDRGRPLSFKVLAHSGTPAQ